MATDPTEPVGDGAVTVDLPVPEGALAIGAHPDDIEFGCGATLAKWAAAGCEIHHLICTDGSKGSWDPAEDRAPLVARRQEEQRAAAAALGARGEVVFLGWPDGELVSGLRQRWEIAFWIRRLQPSVVLGHDPWRRYRLHPDHRHAGFLATDGIVAARDPHFFPEQQLPPHRPSTLLLWEAEEPDHVEALTDGPGSAVAAKLAALLAHRSQWRSTMGVAGDGTDAEGRAQLDAFAARIRRQLAEHGSQGGVELGEAFKALRRL